ncbi:glycosyltransferase family 4 protein [Candidatus Uabimicrobium sp. HlEnr_7]|uniref:glycosyltransferase family 4 protein n=1 Tax=Candidatus Uabimicrobium helgolandensis TaxID=3095367 RepID=UPI003558FC3E
MINFILQNKMRSNVFFGISAFFLSFIICMLLVYIIKKHAVKLRLVDAPGERKIHNRTMPLGGGIAIFLAVIFSLCSCIFLYKAIFSIIIFYISPQIMCILISGFFIFIVGLVDDYISLKPRTKLCCQIIAAVCLFLFDIKLTVFIDNDIFSFFITIFWIVLITNAFNLLDNMDGLSSGVAFIIGLILIWVMVCFDQWSIVFVLCALLGALLGFLRYNFSPASIFMGDSGSLFIGYTLASLTIYADFYQMNFPHFAVALPILAFAIPIFDTTTVVLYRLREGRPVFEGDTNHFSHRLTKLGLSTQKAVLVIYLVTFATGINATLLYQVDDWLGAMVIVVQLMAILFIIHILEHTAYVSKSQE